MKLDYCSDTDAAHWVLEPVDDDVNRAQTEVIIRPERHRYEALAVGASQGTWWLVDIRQDTDQRNQRWRVPFDLPSRPAQP